MIAAEIILERETANDDSALVVAIHALSGTAVEADALIFDIENSKATQELRAPSAGILAHNLKVGESVAFGVPIARIIPASGIVDAAPMVPARPAPEVSAGRGAIAEGQAGREGRELARPGSAGRAAPRFSRAAQAMMQAERLLPADFDGGFVTTDDILARLRALPPSPRDVPRHPLLTAETGTGLPISRTKRAEIDVLSAGAGATMLSVLGVTLGPLAMRRAPGDVMAGQITDLVIFEAARLMRKYPNLNAFYREGTIVRHEAVHAGLAIDGGGRLVVYGIENADRVSLPDLSPIISDAAARYVGNELSSAEMSRATFTVTDLSGDDLDFVLPLLPRGQSCIVGITRGAQAGFRLFAGFDHRVTEGREVAMFLRELVERLRSFAERERAAVEPCCSFCDRSLGEATGKGRDKGLLKVIDRQGSEVLCCASCWNGW